MLFTLDLHPMEGVAERIQKMINAKGISNSEMADFIGLPRPILSHILSGRNKPSLVVIQKIITAYPEVNMKWLLIGEGDMINSLPIENPTISENPNENYTTDPSVDLFTKTQESFHKPTPPTQPDAAIQKIEAIKTQEKSSNHDIAQIIHYYKDGTFKVFTPKG